MNGTTGVKLHDINLIVSKYKRFFSSSIEMKLRVNDLTKKKINAE